MQTSAPGRFEDAVQNPSRASHPVLLRAAPRRVLNIIPKPQGSTGFTLVEILVVMVIIALGSALMSLSLGQTSDERIRANARAVGGFFSRVADEAAVRGHTLRVTVREDRLQLEDLAKSPNTSDVGPANPSPPQLASRVVKLLIDGEEKPTHTPILFPPGGGGSFALTLEFEGTRFEVTRDALGRLAVREPS